MMDGVTQQPEIRRFSFTTDNGVGARAALGLLVLESDHTIEHEFRDFCDFPGVAIFHARLANDVVVTPETLANMERTLPVAASLLPQYLDLTAIGYGCTSASTIIGEVRVAEIIAKAHPAIPSSNPLTAAKAALGVLGIQRLGLLTPYTPDVTLAMQAKFDEAGIAVTVVGSFYEDSDAVVGRIEPEAILDATVALGQSEDVDGVFISCTSLRAAPIIGAAEEALGKPVTASNHALAWHLLRLAGIEDTRDDRGRLFRLPL